MKQYRLMHMLLLVAMLLAGVSCTNDLSEELQTSATPLDGLAIGFDTGSKFTRVDVPSESTLREDLVDHVDVFIFDGTTGTLVNGCYWHKTAAGMEENQTRTETLLDGEWKTSPLSGTDYDVYVVANLHSSSDLSEVQSVAGLQDIIERDADIYKVYNETDNPGKLFTMSGMVEGFNPQKVDDEYILPVTLKRVAAKIEIHLAFDPEFAEKYESTNVLQRLLNYGTSAYALEGQDDIYAAERASMDVEEEAYQYDASKNEATLVLYTYPTEWETDVMQETFVVVNVPVVNKEEGEDATYNSNYYKIPLRSVTDAKRLERNHLYRVNATIAMLGNYTPDTPVELKKVEYAVQDWVTVPIIIDGDNPQYLVLSEDTIIMKNVETSGKQQIFTSSSFLAPSGENDEYAVTLLTDREHTFTYNKYGQPTALSSSLLGQIQTQVNFDPNTLSGTITVNSPVPTNNGVRYMTFRVTNSQGSEAYFLVKQYPLEYVTSTQGVRGYRADNSYSGNIYRALKATEKWDGTSTIRYTNHSGTQNGEVVGTLNNARMYHIMITRTGGVSYGDEYYTLANPLIDEDGYTIPTEENTNLVAPSFMIASQLGATFTMSYDNAKRHCQQYREVTKVRQPDGTLKEVTFSDWRLPTLAELKIINKFQDEDDSAIDVVLSGTTYWYAYEEEKEPEYPWGEPEIVHYTYNPQDNTTAETDDPHTIWGQTIGGGNIRCVRTAPELMAD